MPKLKRLSTRRRNEIAVKESKLFLKGLQENVLNKPIEGVFDNTNTNTTSTTVNSDLHQASQNCVSEIIEPLHDIHSESLHSNLFIPNESSRALSFKDKLRNYAVENKINHSQLNNLLRLLIDNGHPELPTDSRTLLETPRIVPLRRLGDGNFCDFGLALGLQKILHNYSVPMDTKLKLQFSVDGLPIADSSVKQFWPILCSVSNIDPPPVFIVSLFEGNSKPENVNDFLQNFVNELNYVIANKVKINNGEYEVEIEAFICDAPARAYITGTVSHGAYNACHKCTVRGQFDTSVVYLETNAPLRTDEDFRSKKYLNHHKKTTILENLPIDMIKTFPLDYMHLVCLGVVKKIISVWHGKPGKGKLDSKTLDFINNNLKKCHRWLPLEISRRFSVLTHYKKWKATEFRTFLLYTGPVCLKSVLSPSYFKHFMTLSISVRILVSSTSFKMIDYAKELILYFVNNFATLYGKNNMTYNVHNLIHLSEDAKIFGPLDKFSAFKFENHLGKIKSLLRSGPKPLQQVYKRHHELSDILFRKEMHFSANYANFPNFILTNKQGNNVALLKSSKIIKVLHVDNDTMTLTAIEINRTDSFYDKPTNLNIFNIGILEFETHAIQQTYHFEDVIAKMVLIPHKDKFVFLPLCHTKFC